MKTTRFDNAGTVDAGPFKLTITHHDGSKEIIRHTAIGFWDMTHRLEHCWFKSFSVELDK